jgi:hypothetical protein
MDTMMIVTVVKDINARALISFGTWTYGYIFPIVVISWARIIKSTQC